MSQLRRTALAVLVASAIASAQVEAAPRARGRSTAPEKQAAQPSGEGEGPRVIYPKKTTLDFEGTSIEGELRSPGEFYFKNRKEERFDSLVKRRKNFHREMLRDVVLSK